jgi:hypothetical protein
LDGFDRFAEVSEDDQSSGVSFVPVVFEIPEPIDVAEAVVTLSYSASDPGAVTTNELGVYVLPSGHLRLWAKDGSEQRSTNAVWRVVAPGDYLPPTSSDGIPATEIGFSDSQRSLTFYLEAVRPSDTQGDQRIVFTVDPDGDGPLGSICTDAARVTALDFDFELMARDPEADDIYECSSLVLLSHPVPQIDIQTLVAEIDGDVIEVSVEGLFTDRMSEISGNRVDSISVMYGDEELDTINVPYGGPGVMPWQPATSGFPFSRTYTLPRATPGAHILRFIAGPNAAGEVGQAAASVFVEERVSEVQPVPPTAPISIVFSAPPSTNTQDSAIVYFGDREPAEGDLTVAEPSGRTNDFFFAGSIMSGTNAVPFQLVMCDSLVFTNSVPEEFSAVARYVLDGPARDLCRFVADFPRRFLQCFGGG